MAVSFLLTDTELPADCLSTDSAGDCIQFTGDPLGDRYQVTRADPRALIHASGIIIRKATWTQCTIKMAGFVTGLVTGFVPNGLVWLGIDGRLTQDRSTITALPGGETLIQPLGFAPSSTTVYLLPQDPINDTTVLSRRDVAPNEASNGVRRIFTAPDKFDPASFLVLHNGRQLTRAKGVHSPAFGDYYVTESGGTGTGFDTFVMLSFTPSTHSVLRLEYLLGP